MLAAGESGAHGAGCASSRRPPSSPSPGIRRSAPPSAWRSSAFRGQTGQDAVIVLEEGVGPVRCGVRLSERGGFAEFDCPKLPGALRRAGREGVHRRGARAGAGRDRLREPRAERLDGRRALPFRAGQEHGGARQGGLQPERLAEGVRPERRLPLYARDGRPRPFLPRPHVRSRDRHHRGSGDRLGGRGVRRRRPSTSTPCPTAITAPSSSRVSRWAARR